MKFQSNTRRIFLVAASVLAVGVLAVGATGCSSATSQAPVATPQAAAPAPAPAAASPAAAPAAAATADGAAVVKSSCVGQCHGANLVSYHTSKAGAERVVNAMAGKANLDQAKADALVAYFSR